MEDFGFRQMQEIQQELQSKYIEKWGGLSPEKARDKFLWMIAEAGEAAQIIKKNGDGGIINDDEIRHHFIEEMCDILMYFNDVMLCYSITPDEIEKVYKEKHKRNMTRW